MLAPRGSGKTTVITTGLLAWIVALRPNIRIGLFSQKAEKAEAMSSAIMGVIDGSDEYREVWGDLHGTKKWTASEWLIKGSPHYKTKDRTMVTGGADQSSSAVSKRFDLILCDDILDENNTYTIDRREKLATWFWKTLKPTQAAEGAAVLVIGTRWVEDDLYQQLIEVNKWQSLVIDAIIEHADGTETSYWPEVWPMDRLYAEREDVGWDNFACSYRNDVKGLREGTLVKREWFQHFDELPTDRTYTWTMGVDLASSEKERADYTARATVAQDDRGEHWVMAAKRIKTESGHREFVEEGYAAFPQISKVLIETNQHQAVFVQDLLRQTKIPAVGRREDVDKRVRHRSAAARYEAHMIHHHRSLKGGPLEDELLAPPGKGHDDLYDALCLAMDIQTTGGAIAAVRGGVRAPGEPKPPALPPSPEDILFREGVRRVPPHVAALLTGIDTTDLTFEEAMSRVNQARLHDYVRSALAGVIPRR
jgi:phage terminase large subunit-like protein